MNTHDKYELPPPPQGEYRLSPDSRAPTLYDEEAMQDYARAAIEADRQARKVDKAGYTSGPISDGGLDPRNANERQARGEPVLYQSRTRPILTGANKNWTAWENCTKDQANDYRRAKVLHDWEYEVRELYTTPQPQQIPEGWQLVPKRPTEEMIEAANNGDDEYTLRNFGPRMQRVMQGPEDHYVAMLAAAPKPEDTP